MNHGEQHKVARRLELKRDAAGAAPRDGELTGRIELGDSALQPVLLAKSVRSLAGRIAKLAVAPDEFERRADLHLHLTRRQPLAAQVALGEIGPDALDGPGQNALDLERGRFGQRAIGARACDLVHWSSPLGAGDLGASSSRRSRSST